MIRSFLYFSTSIHLILLLYLCLLTHCKLIKTHARRKDTWKLRKHIHKEKKTRENDTGNVSRGDPKKSDGPGCSSMLCDVTEVCYSSPVMELHILMKMFYIRTCFLPYWCVDLSRPLFHKHKHVTSCVRHAALDHPHLSHITVHAIKCKPHGQHFL